jgi:hypothetical protein
VPNGSLSTFLEYVWAPFVALFWWFITRLTSKIDEIEKEKADVGAISRIDAQLHEFDRRIDELGHTTVPRKEYKSDITLLHERANALERQKEDKVTKIRLIENSKKDDPT